MCRTFSHGADTFIQSHSRERLRTNWSNYTSSKCCTNTFIPLKNAHTHTNTRVHTHTAVERHKQPLTLLFIASAISLSRCLNLIKSQDTGTQQATAFPVRALLFCGSQQRHRRATPSAGGRSIRDGGVKAQTNPTVAPPEPHVNQCGSVPVTVGIFHPLNSAYCSCSCF